MFMDFFRVNSLTACGRERDKLSRSNETALTRFFVIQPQRPLRILSTATVLLLRELKIPARYAVGYAVHEKSGKGMLRASATRIRGASCGMKKLKSGKISTQRPAHGIEMEGKRASLWERFSDFLSWIGFEISKAQILWGQGKLREYIFWSLIPILIFLLYQIIFGQGRKRRQMRQK